MPGLLLSTGLLQVLGAGTTVHLQSKKPDKPHRHGLTKVAALSSAATLVLTLVVACRRVRQRYFAGIAKIGGVRLYAGFKVALASLYIRAMLFHVSRTGLDVYGLDQDVLALDHASRLLVWPL